MAGSGDSSLVIQVLLVLAILGVSAWMFARRGARALAVRRLLVLAFGVFAILTVVFPGFWTSAAHLVGVGRGADLLLYATVVVLLGFMALQEVRGKNQEKRFTVLARRIALDESVQPADHRRRALTGAPTPDPAPDDPPGVPGP